MSVSTTSTLLSDLSASSDASSKPSSPRRRLEISTGDGLFYLFVCGVKGVGKTSLVTRYCQNRFPNWYDPPEPTEINHHSVETVSQHQCLFECVEVDSPSLSGDISDSCPAGWGAIDGLLLVYDVGDRSSFTALSEYCTTILELTGKALGEVPVAVVANKLDIFQDSRDVSYDEGAEFATAIGGIFAEVSARENDGVRKVFQQIMKECVKNRISVLDEKDESEKRKKVAREMAQKVTDEQNMTRRQKLKRSMSSKLSIGRLSIGSAS